MTAEALKRLQEKALIVLSNKRCGVTLSLSRAQLLLAANGSVAGALRDVASGKGAPPPVLVGGIYRPERTPVVLPRERKGYPESASDRLKIDHDQLNQGEESRVGKISSWVGIVAGLSATVPYIVALPRSTWLEATLAVAGGLVAALSCLWRYWGRPLTDASR